jgi:hypothetical protein
MYMSGPFGQLTPAQPIESSLGGHGKGVLIAENPPLYL